ncbi:MAG: ArnT family glycosyltransferase [Prochlorothrix sp.]
MSEYPPQPHQRLSSESSDLSSRELPDAPSIAPKPPALPPASTASADLDVAPINDLFAPGILPLRLPWLSHLGPQGQAYLYLALIAFPLLLLRSPQQSLMAHDEGIYAGQALDIVRSGNWINPVSFTYDRTIGIQWVIALAYHLFGVGEGVARLPSTLACLLGLGLTYRIGALLLSPSLGFLGAVILSLSHLWIQYGRLSTQDMPLVGLELLGFWALLEAGRCAVVITDDRAVQSPDPSTQDPITRLVDPAEIRPETHSGVRLQARSRSRLGGRPVWWPSLGWGRPEITRQLWLLLVGVSFGLACFIKGFMVLPVAAAALPYFIATETRYRTLRSWGLYLGLVLGLAPLGFWLGASVVTYGSWEPLQGLVGKLSKLSQESYLGAGFTYYLWNLPANSFPWFVFSLWGTGILWQRCKCAQAPLPLGGIWLVGVYPWLLMGELTLFATRTRYYPLQVLPFWSLLAALGFAQMLSWYREDRVRPRLGQKPDQNSNQELDQNSIQGRTDHGRTDQGRTAQGEPIQGGAMHPRVSYWNWGLLWIASGLGLLLTLGGVGVWVAIGLGILPADNLTYGLLALTWGGPWLVMGVITWRDRQMLRDRRRFWPWLGSLLCGPWLTIALLGSTGLWGNYNPQLKTFLEQESIAALIQSEHIHWIRGQDLSTQARKTGLLLEFYTTHPGQSWTSLDQLSPGAYAWVSDTIALDTASVPYQNWGEINGWQLIQRSF